MNKVAANGSFQVRRVTQTWTEAGITYNNAPLVSSTPEVTVALTTADIDDYRAIEITQLVKDWLDGVLVNNGIALIPVSSTLTLDTGLDSKEAPTTSHDPV